MFGQPKNQNPVRRGEGASAKDGGVTILTSGCHFSGKLFCRGATRIGGTIDGEVVAEGLLIVEEDAIINASVRAEEIVVHGRVEGKLTVQQKIELCATADVHADVATPKLVVHEGALFNGQTSMVRSATQNQQETKNKKEQKIRRLEAGAAADSSAKEENNVAARIPDVGFA